MRLLILTPYLVSVVAAKAVSYDAPEGGNKVSYKDDQAIRLGVGDNASKIKRMMKDLSLSTWNGAPQANNYVDLVVPQSKLAAFKKSTANMDAQIMHEDLGASIEIEAKHGTYSGISNSISHSMMKPTNSKILQRLCYLSLVRLLSPLRGPPPLPLRSAIPAQGQLQNHFRRQLNPRPGNNWNTHLRQERKRGKPRGSLPWYRAC